MVSLKFIEILFSIDGLILVVVFGLMLRSLVSFLGLRISDITIKNYLFFLASTDQYKGLPLFQKPSFHTYTIHTYTKHDHEFMSCCLNVNKYLKFMNTRPYEVRKTKQLRH